MKKMVFLVVLAVLFTSVNAYCSPADVQEFVALSAEPIVGRTIEVVTNEEPATFQWKYADSEDGTYTDIAGATGKSLLVNPDLLGKWLKVTADGVESEPYQEKSASTLLAGEGFQDYTEGIVTEENGNKYYDNPGSGNRLTFSFDKQTEGRIAVEFRYKYAGGASDSMVLSLSDEAGQEGAIAYFFTDSIGTWGQVNNGFSWWMKPEGGVNNDGNWHTIQIIANLTSKGMEMYIDGQKRVSVDQTKWDTKYFQNDLSQVTFDFKRTFSMDDLKIYKINGTNEAPYVEGMMRLLGGNAEIKSEYNNCIIKDYDHDSIAWTTYEWSYSDTENGPYTKIEASGISVDYNSAYKYIKCDVSVCDDLGAITTVTMGPSPWTGGKQMPYMNQPTLSGECTVGATLTRTSGGVAGEYGQIDQGTKWYRAKNAAGPWTTEIGAGDTYTLTAADAGYYITCCVMHDSPIEGDVMVHLTRTAQPVFCPGITSLQYVEEDGTSADGAVKVTAEIKNKTGAGFPFKLIHAYYQENQLADIEILSYSCPANAGYVKITAPLGKMREGYTVKSFILKDFESLSPLGTAIEKE